jgi:2-polyprenyl-3-methyl-5-hydroxy-6-metoxy-1,4-benzoquinol methylase
MTHIANTGERILLEKETPLMIARHFCAYGFAKRLCIDKKVLDIGCGEGYGSNFLAKTAKSVTGIDYSSEAVAYASEKYRKPNLKFMRLDVKELGSLAEKFDRVCCFQVIEHLADADLFLEDIRDLLLEEGRLIISTCNMKDASPDSDVPANKFHVREYYFIQFKELLQRHFGSVEMHGLKRTARLNFYRRLKKIGICKQLYVNAGPECFKIVRSRFDDALDFIAVCGK